MDSIPYNNELKKMEFSDVKFNTIFLEEIPVPYYEDYSNYSEITYRNYKSWDTLGFRDYLLEYLSKLFSNKVLKIKIISPKENELYLHSFVYLRNKTILPLFIENTGNFKAWMDIIFHDMHERVKEDTKDECYESQQELNFNPQIELTLAKGDFSMRHTNSKIRNDLPFENVGLYLSKNAPKQYNEAKIAKEKQNYIKKYIDTAGNKNFNESKLKQLFDVFISTKKLKLNPPANNKSVYKEFEALSGYPFPKELQTLLVSHNGIENTDFLTAEQILNEWKNWKEIYDSVDWMLIDLTGNNHPDGRKTVGIYTNPYWIPFLSTGGGNFIAIDYAPGSKGTSGQIIAFGADEIKIRFIAENMEDLLEQFISGNDVLNNGFEK